MIRFHKLFLSLMVLFAFGYAQEDQMLDSNFRSIHQLEKEAHQEDELTGDTILEKEFSDSKRQQNQMRSIINLSLVIVMMLVLIAAFALILILRRIHRSRERETDVTHQEK